MHPGSSRSSIYRHRKRLLEANIMRTLFASNLLQEINWQGKNEKAGIAHLDD